MVCFGHFYIVERTSSKNCYHHHITHQSQFCQCQDFESTFYWLTFSANAVNRHVFFLKVINLSSETFDYKITQWFWSKTASEMPQTCLRLSPKNAPDIQKRRVKKSGKSVKVESWKPIMSQSNGSSGTVVRRKGLSSLFPTCKKSLETQKSF